MLAISCCFQMFVVLYLNYPLRENKHSTRYVLRTYLYGSPCSWENLGMFYVRINMPESLSLALDYLLLFLCTFNSKYF